ncbi:HAD hydrolase-like protein [Candidatus Deianiraea vastatrix]|uniref:HAD hydrolase n=1 Tax=Candidatus Deianiraea vastatrix TaxID=2163644 RepID=A0A5B8XC37_9RICK|nr:HAD hydrolase-like protein [Candidatus Deianiraea vastatrix]QED22913.1 Putative HAD hydrolase [Candidatus Deianiraea vastatrix]
MFAKIQTIIDDFDIFLLDIFGLIHDGALLYDGAKEMLLEIKKQGKRAIFISNAPRTAIQTAQRLENVGITTDLYEKIFTPGELFLNKCKNGEFGGKYFGFGNKLDIDLIANIKGLQRVSDLNEADFLVSFGMFETREENDEISAKLQLAKGKNLKMICVNPDIIVKQKAKNAQFTKEGELKGVIVKDKNGHLDFLCAGHIAKLYEEIGGSVSYFGKPFADIYNEIFNYLGNINKEKIIAIGDSFETDIKGANGVNIKSALVLTGIHGSLLNGDILDKNEFERLSKKHDAKPDFVLKDLT